MGFSVRAGGSGAFGAALEGPAKVEDANPSPMDAKMDRRDASATLDLS
jgi:hypothetical protein